MKLYHYTPSKNVPSILRKGLSPGVARGTTELSVEDPTDIDFLREEKSYLYLADKDTVGELLTGAHSGGYLEKPLDLTILGVEVERSKLEKDPSDSVRGGYRTKEHIPSKSIKVVKRIRVGKDSPSALIFGDPYSNLGKSGYYAATWRHFFGEDIFTTPADTRFWTEVEEKRGLRSLLKLPRSSRFRATRQQLLDLRGYGGGHLDSIIDKAIIGELQ